MGEGARRTVGVPGHLSIGCLLLLVFLAAAETSKHLIGLPSTLSAGLLLLSLVPIAYLGLRAGFAAGASVAVVFALYTLHYTSPHEVLFANEADTWRGGAVALVLGLAMAYPMSAIKRREDRLRRELEERNAALVERNREMTEANTALEAFGYVVSHDLKEPVRALENYLDAAREEWPSEESREYLERAFEANRRLARLLQGLLDYSRTSSAETVPRPLHVPRVLEHETCRAQYERLLRKRGGRIEVAPDIPPVLADEVVLCQLFGNVVLNAIRHNDSERPLVRVASGGAPVDGRVEVVVEDNGSGFPPEVLARFGDRWAERPTTLRGGFGLIIAQRAAQRGGGNVRIENVPEGGARVRVTLPAAEAPATEAEQTRKEEATFAS